MAVRKAEPGAQLDVKNLLERGKAAAGLSDYGDMWFVDPLSQLVKFINTESCLATDNDPGVRNIVRYLGDRLKLVDYLKRHPEVFDEKVDVCGVIVAHGRGGSTLTQRLLTASPKLTTTYWWELITPVPLAHESPGGDFSARHKLGNDWIDDFNKTFPEYGHIHPMDPQTADEEVVLFDRTFMSMMYGCYFNLPSYVPWLQEQDQTKAYEELIVWLKLLQHQEPKRKGRKWLLKAVNHFITGGLPTMLKFFPNARAIITHRRLENVLTSFCSSWAPLLRLYAPGTDSKELGPRLIGMYEGGMKKMDALRSDPAADRRFLDLQYKKTIDDPMGQFQFTMDEMGVKIGPEDVQAAADWMAKNGRDTHPPHHYDPADYGFSNEIIATAFKSYHDRYVK